MKTHEMCVVIRWMVVGRGAGYASGRARSSRNPAESRDTTVSSARFLASSSTIRAHPGSDGFHTRTLLRRPGRNASIGTPWRLASSGVTTPIAASRGDPRTTSSAADSCARPLCGLRLKRATHRPHVKLALGRRHHQDGNCGSAQNGFGYQIERARALLAGTAHWHRNEVSFRLPCRREDLARRRGPLADVGRDLHTPRAKLHADAGHRLLSFIHRREHAVAQLVARTLYGVRSRWTHESQQCDFDATHARK